MAVQSCYLYDGPTRPRRVDDKEDIQSSVREIDQVGIPASTKKSKSQSYLEEMAQAVKTVMPEAEVEILQDSIKVLFPQHIRYRSSGYKPIENIDDRMSKLAALLLIYSKTFIMVTGHTDNTGVESQNQVLSQKRADLIREMLINRRVERQRLDSWGLGASSPIADNRTEEGKALNRRVEFIVLTSED